MSEYIRPISVVHGQRLACRAGRHAGDAGQMLWLPNEAKSMHYHRLSRHGRDED